MQFEIISPYMDMCSLELDHHNHSAYPECLQYGFIPVSANLTSEPTNEYMAMVETNIPLTGLPLDVFGINGTEVLEATYFSGQDLNGTEFVPYSQKCILQGPPFATKDANVFKFTVGAKYGLDKVFIHNISTAINNLCTKANADVRMEKLSPAMTAVVYVAFLLAVGGCFWLMKPTSKTDFELGTLDFALEEKGRQGCVWEKTRNEECKEPAVISDNVVTAFV